MITRTTKPIVPPVGALRAGGVEGAADLHAEVGRDLLGDRVENAPLGVLPELGAAERVAHAGDQHEHEREERQRHVVGDARGDERAVVRNKAEVGPPEATSEELEGRHGVRGASSPGGSTVTSRSAETSGRKPSELGPSNDLG